MAFKVFQQTSYQSSKTPKSYIKISLKNRFPLPQNLHLNLFGGRKEGTLKNEQVNTDVPIKVTAKLCVELL